MSGQQLRRADSLGEEERDVFWRPADETWPVYWWRSDIEAWVCAPAITAGVQVRASLTDGRVCRQAGFVELVLDERGRPL